MDPLGGGCGISYVLRLYTVSDEAGSKPIYNNNNNSINFCLPPRELLPRFKK